MDHHMLTHVGMKRGNNQDNLSSLLAANSQQFVKQGHLFLVADGMGGHLGGEKASEMASRIIPLSYTKLIGQTGASIQESLAKAFSEANEAIHRKGHEGRDFFNMGTTCSCLVIREDGAWVAHVGDSRIYLVRGRRIHQLTFDHSMVWQAAKDRGVDPDSVHDVMSNRILRCLGPERLVDTDIQGPYPIRPGDAFVLCSDGLSGFVADSEIATAVANLPAELATRFLVTLANLRGGGDNISVVVVQVPEDIESDGKQELANPQLGETTNNFTQMVWISAAAFGGLSFLIFLPAYFIWRQNEWPNEEWLRILLGVNLISFMVSLAMGLGGLVINNFGRETSGKHQEDHVPISRARKWDLNKTIIESIMRQNLEIINSAESAMAIEQVEAIRIRNNAIVVEIEQGHEKTAFAVAAGVFVELAPMIEKMIRYQQIQPARLVMIKPSV